MAGFHEIIGHEQLIAHLQSAIVMDKVSHAYIINGPKDSGKMMLAQAFAMALQCETSIRNREGATGRPEEKLSPEILAEPCLECHSCKQALGNNQPDIIYLTHEKPNTISVADIREQINHDIEIKPYSSKYKVYIVDEAEKMNQQAQNALLKTIEEPPAYAVILLLTTNADAFLQTIRSRCVMLDIKPVSDEKIREFLMKKRQVPDYKAEVCAAFARGNVGRAVALASSERFNELKDVTVSLLRRLGDIRRYDILQEIKPLNDFKDDIREFFDLVLFWYRDVLLYKAAGSEEQLIFREQALEIRRQAEKSTYHGLQQILEAIETADSLEVAFSDSAVLPGAVKQTDSRMGLTMIRVDATSLDDAQFEKIKPVKLGNSYGVRQGDLVISMGSPAGMVHSSSYGFISYIAKNVQMTDGNARVLYADIKSKADAGTFLFNTEGELVGWATDRYEQDVDTGMKTFMSISDYKGALELLSNGIQVPYLGIEGQEVTSEMEKNGMTSGIYMIAAAAESPAYNAGLQPGDILSGINDIKIEGMKNFQAQVEKLHVGDRITVTVQRNNGKDEYKEIEFEVTVGAR